MPACVCMQALVLLLEMTGFSRISVEKRANEPGTGRHKAEWRQNCFVHLQLFSNPFIYMQNAFIAKSRGRSRKKNNDNRKTHMDQTKKIIKISNELAEKKSRVSCFDLLLFLRLCLKIGKQCSEFAQPGFRSRCQQKKNEKRSRRVPAAIEKLSKTNKRRRRGPKSGWKRAQAATRSSDQHVEEESSSSSTSSSTPTPPPI